RKRCSTGLSPFIDSGYHQWHGNKDHRTQTPLQKPYLRSRKEGCAKPAWIAKATISITCFRQWRVASVCTPHYVGKRDDADMAKRYAPRHLAGPEPMPCIGYPCKPPRFRNH